MPLRASGSLMPRAILSRYPLCSLSPAQSSNAYRHKYSGLTVKSTLTAVSDKSYLKVVDGKDGV